MNRTRTLRAVVARLLVTVAGALLLPCVAMARTAAPVAKHSAGVAGPAIHHPHAKHRAAHSVVKAVAKLRPGAKEHVMTAIPGLGRVVDRYI